MVLAWVLAGLAAGCGGPRAADDPILSRPAVTASDPLRLAFTAGGRVWVADAGGWVASAVPAEGHADRPAWLAGGRTLALSAWSGGQADLAVWPDSAGVIQRVIETPADELLDDVAPDGRLLFERGGILVEAALRRRGGGAFEAGPERALVPGRDGRYTPDARHVVFVRGNGGEPLGLWRQGYAGGDDSEVFLLDLESLAVTRLTDNPDNDELAVPLDDAGRRFIACRERGGPYRPWLVDVLSSRVHRVRRFPAPAGEWPVVFPAVRRGAGTGVEIELWYEADGRLYRTAGAVRDTGLAFAPPALVPIVLAAADGPGVGKSVFPELSEAVAASPLAAGRWRAIPTAERRRFGDEMARDATPEAVRDLVLRLVGRLGLAGFDYELPGRATPPGPEADPVLARALADSGLAYVPLARLDAGPISSLTPLAAGGIVLDLRAARGGDRLAADAMLGRVDRPVIALISARTSGWAEILADELRAAGRGRLVGRPTAGVVVATQARALRAGGTLTVPVARVERSGGGTFDSGVSPDVFVPEETDPAAEAWLEAVLAARR